MDTILKRRKNPPFCYIEVLVPKIPHLSPPCQLEKEQKQKALKPIIQALKNNDSVGILMDQAVIPDEGYVIDFLGRGAWTTKMPALLARKTGAAVLPAFIHRTDGRHKIKIYPQVELSGDNDKENAVKEDTKKFSRYIEEYIKEHPAEWLWIHRRWKRVNSNQ